MFGPIYDFLNGLTWLLSLIKGQNTGATLTGDYKSIEGVNGPITALVGCGTNTGSPDSFSATFTLLEADDSSGTNSQAIAVQSDAVVLTANKTIGEIRATATKPYVAVKCVLAFVNGSTPKQDVFGAVVGAKSRV